MSIRNENVVVVGAGLNALGILRSLANRFNVLLITEKGSYVDKSKYGSRIYVESTTSETVISVLSELAPSFKQKPALLLTEEKTVFYVSLHQHQLQGYRLDFSSHELMESLQSKEGFQALAESAGSPVPKSVIVKSEQDLNSLEQLTFPCVFKPMVQCKQYGKRFKKAYKTESASEISQLYTDIKPVMSEMIAQEWIEGKDSDIYFCLAYFDQRSQLVSAFSGRKLRSWPLHIGGTAACTAAPEHHQELLSLTASFVEHINYVGLIGMEFKYDVERKAFYMIEPTVGRTDYQHEVASLSGTDFLGDIVRHMLGNESQNVSPASLKPVIWFDEFADANALANGAQPFSELSYPKVGALKRWNDIGPYLFYLQVLVKRWCKSKL